MEEVNLPEKGKRTEEDQGLALEVESSSFNYPEYQGDWYNDPDH